MCVSWKIYSRQKQLSNWGHGLHPRYAPRLTATESQHGLIKLAQYAKHESAINKTFLYEKEHSAQPDMFLKTHQIKPDPKLMRVMPLRLLEAHTRPE
jgi:hypothetical protein